MHARSKLLSLLRLSHESSAAEVRSRYLAMVMASHPDTSHQPEAAARFCELKAIWDEYQSERKRRGGSHEPGSFTAFGVGCSWNDSSEEHVRRMELVEQASRGVMNPQRLE